MDEKEKFLKEKFLKTVYHTFHDYGESFDIKDVIKQMENLKKIINYDRMIPEQPTALQIMDGPGGSAEESELSANAIVGPSDDTDDLANETLRRLAQKFDEETVIVSGQMAARSDSEGQRLKKRLKAKWGIAPTAAEPAAEEKAPSAAEPGKGQPKSPVLEEPEPAPAAPAKMPKKK